VFDSSENSGPIEYKIREGKYFPLLEQGVVGMIPGESKTIPIPMDEAYGPRLEERIFEFDRKRAPEGFDPSIGQQIQMYRADGKPVNVTVIGISETSFTMDCNHPFAGKDLLIDVTLVGIV
ncbi:MAG: FKBP-type peptidyl-prolyl cis-trans isomerase, partial [Nitrospirae bacterium]|nr:FKBP-type peptidyl-prolyl cis-trans isomerase [Nitrospirota bacterium]